MADTAHELDAVLPAFIEERIEPFNQKRFKSAWGGRHLLHGATPSTDSIRLSSNDYLCLSSEYSLLEAQAQAIINAPKQVLMSPVFHDERSAMRILEKALARYMGTPDGILCQSGWAANTGLMQAIASEHTPVYLDHLAHMSLWYGARAVRAPVYPFRHNDAVHLEEQIHSKGSGIIAVDAIYSTNGDLCELRKIASVARRTQSALVVDESHSLGVYGKGGASVTQTLGLENCVHFITVSLAKTFAGRAGLVGCPKGLRDYFMMASYPTCFSSTLLDHELVWLEHALSFITAQEARREQLRVISQCIRQQLHDAGIPVNNVGEQIIALEAGNEPQTMQLRDALESRGIFGSVFCSPATPLRHALIRLSLNSSVSFEQADQIVQGTVAAYSMLRKQS